jgi:hypothetical protein
VNIFAQSGPALAGSALVDDGGGLHILGWSICFAPIISLRIFTDDGRLPAPHAEHPNARRSRVALDIYTSSTDGGDRAIDP